MIRRNEPHEIPAVQVPAALLKEASDLQLTALEAILLRLQVTPSSATPGAKETVDGAALAEGVMALPIKTLEAVVERATKSGILPRPKPAAPKRPLTPVSDVGDDDADYLRRVEAILADDDDDQEPEPERKRSIPRYKMRKRPPEPVSGDPPAPASPAVEKPTPATPHREARPIPPVIISHRGPVWLGTGRHLGDVL